MIVRVFAAFPIARTAAGVILTDHAAVVRCESEEAARAMAETMAQTAPNVAALAFTRTVDMATGECSPVELIAGFGDEAVREQCRLVDTVKDCRRIN